MVDGDARVKLKGGGDEIVILADAAQARVGMKAFEDGVLVSNHSGVLSALGVMEERGRYVVLGLL